MRKIVYTTILALTALLACSRAEEGTAPQTIVPLYRMMADFSSMSTAARDSFMTADSAQIRAMVEVIGGGSPTADQLTRWSQSMPVTIFTPPTDSVFPTLAPLEDTLGIILARAGRESLDLPRRSYAAVVWGNRRSIVINGDVVLIALNHYLGQDYPGYGHWPLYMRIDKKPGRLPYDITEALVASRYAYDGGTNATVLSRLIYEGVLAAVKMALVPDAKLTEALGYSEKELEWLDENQTEIWRQIVGQNLLYDTSEITADRLVAPAPATSIISPDTPRRAGRYIGYRIVSEYMRHHSDVTLQQMLRPDFYTDQAVLIESGYEGK
ncbi:MAG: hypothetical protein Q4C34_04160 [Bacteroidales bacterium]|nr:hypothetical protein [Bacteroidales bacterium]